MRIAHIVSGEWVEVIISRMRAKDLREIQKIGEFVFDWEAERTREVYKLTMREDESQILGLLSVEDFREEFRIHLNLLEVRSSQVGKAKTLDNIAGCLIAYACKLAFKRGYGGFVSLLPKTNLISLYQKKYGFSQYGRHLAVEYESSKQLIDKFLADEQI